MFAFGTAQHGFIFFKGRPPAFLVYLLLVFFLAFIAEPSVTFRRHPEFHKCFLVAVGCLIPGFSGRPVDQFKKRYYTWFGNGLKGLSPFFLTQFATQEVYHWEMDIPAVKSLDTGKTKIFGAAVRKTDLVTQPGTPDLKVISRGDLNCHLN